MRTAFSVILLIAAGVLITTGFRPSDAGTLPTSIPDAAERFSGDPECGYDADIPAVEDYMRLITFGDPYKGNFDADVTVIEYFDPNCPHCKTMHPIMNNVIQERGEKARYFMVPYVLWQYSLIQVEALFVAGQDGKYFEMLDAQYEHQQPGGMSIDELTALAKEIGLDPEVFRARVERGMNQGMIMARRQEIIDMGIRGTPAVMINGRVIDGQSKSFECIVELIDKAAAEAEG
jgi:protein-disulfide isomerase